MTWDAVAAIAGVLACFLFFHASIGEILRHLWIQLLGLLWPQTRRCDSLPWTDVPDGLIHTCYLHIPPQEDYLHCPHHTPVALDHDAAESDEECFRRTIGFVFNRAWNSAVQRNAVVPKPRQLDPRKTYVRVDANLLLMYAFMIGANRYSNPIQFKESGKLMTATLKPDGDCGYSINFRPGLWASHLSKREIENLVLRRYPPHYREFIPLPSGQQIRSPIREDRDIYRGGWIVGAGVTWGFPAILHNMKYHHAGDSTGRSLMKTDVEYAIERLLERLEALRALLPDNELLQNVVSEAKSQIADPGERRFGSGFSHLRSDYWKRWSTEEIARKEFTAKLLPSQWEVILLAFNPAGTDFSPDAVTILTSHSEPVLLAAMVGIWDVLTYGQYCGYSHTIWLRELGVDIRGEDVAYGKLPDFPELRRRKYVYITSCAGSREEDE